MATNHSWTKKGFDDFMKGTLGNGGQNLYVSAKGILQRIFQFDMTGNGYPDLLFANSHSMNERPPLYLYNNPFTEDEPKELRSNGAFDGLMCDLTGDGKMDVVVACQHNGVHADISSILYFSSDEGASERYLVELPAPSAMGVVAGDFNGSGKKALCFIGSKHFRFFYQTELGIEACKFTDVATDAISVACADLDGDGYDDLYVLTQNGYMRVYWGGKDGITEDNYTELPMTVKVHEECNSTTAGRSLVRKLPWGCSIIDYKGKKCIFRGEDNGDAVLDSFDSNRNRTEEARFPVGGAYCMASGDLTGNGSCDLAIGVHTDRCKFENSYVLFEKDGYDLNKATKFETRACHSFTISPAEKGGKPCLFVAQTGTRYLHNVPCQVLTFDDCGNVETKKELPGQGCTRILVGDTGSGKYQTIMINNEGETPWGLEDIYIYTGDENGYSPDRRIELPGCAAVDGYMIDFTDNGNPDVMVVNCAENAPHLCPGISIYHNDGNGPDREKVTNIPAILPHGAAIGDFRKCGYLDVLTGGIRNREIRIYRGGPDGYTAENVQKIVFGPKADEFVPFPWDKEGVDPDYSSEEAARIVEWGGLRWLFAADFNNDGYLDLFISQITGANCMILWGGPDGYSLDNMQLLATDGAGCANACDLTGNGYLDLVLGSHLSKGKKVKNESYLTIYWGGPDGYKENRKTQLPIMCSNSVSIGDFNGDGFFDIFVTSYNDSRNRDIDAYLFYGNEDHVYSTKNMELIRNHSGCGCVAGDFNNDGYCDLAVASHKDHGSHVCDSYVYWGGPDGIKDTRKIALPTRGCHGMTTVDMGNVMDRSGNEYYYSEIYSAHNGATLKKASWEATIGKVCDVWMHVRTADSEEAIKDAPWSDKITNGEDVEKLGISGKFIQYKLVLYARNGCGTPRVESVTLEF